MITIEFREAPKENRDHDRILLRMTSDAVPDVGEVVNVYGEPYRVLERGWSFDGDDNVYCTLRVR